MSKQQQNRSLQSVAMIVASVVLALTVASCSQEKTSNTETETKTTSAAVRNVRTEVVAVSRFHRSIEATGTVAFDQNRSTQVLSPISGPVARILAGFGSHVSRGEAMAVVASPDFAAAMSALRRAEATARNAKRVAELDRQLFKNDAIARRDMEQAETDAVGADADRDSALQQLRSLGVTQQTIDDIQQNRPVTNPGGTIRSPLDGTVVEKLISPGQLLQAGTTPCFTVADLSNVWVLANVFESDLPFVKIGDTAEVMTGAGAAPMKGRVSYIAALVDPNTRAVSVRIDVPNPGDVLKRDLYVRAIIQSQTESQGLLVPVSAVLRDEENLPFVFVAKPDGTFGRQSVQLGSRLGDQQQITGGITAGQTIVVEGGLFLSTVEHS
jgi:cobalt-zinc-cadmium efflux system membrane fusion protein